MLSIASPESVPSSEILPDGDAWPHRRPRRGLRWEDLRYILPLVLIALSVAAWLGCRLEVLLALLPVIVLGVWWRLAWLPKLPQANETPTATPSDPEVLREEVRQWQVGNERSAER